MDVELELISSSKSTNITLSGASYAHLAEQIFNYLQQNYDVLQKKPAVYIPRNDREIMMTTRGKLALLAERYEQLIVASTSADSIMIELIADAYLQKGISEIEETSASNLKNEEINVNFRRLLNLLIPFSREGRDTEHMNLVLAQMYMHSQNYGMAEICLEKAITQHKYHPKIYYYLSFLHESRYKERGFKTRADVLDYAVHMDPGYADAVFELANQLYETGTAAVTDPNTERSINILNAFLELNPETENILSLLGRILLQSKYTLEAMEIYEKLILLYPNTAEHHYNLGICYFHKKDYEKSENQFRRAIELNDYSNAYLYLGVIYRLRGDMEKALYYYRERVRRKSTDDDEYARQAMKGIRLVLHDMAELEEAEMASQDSTNIR
jgi:tetratricopeptide (TPR) repeat protein